MNNLSLPLARDLDVSSRLVYSLGEPRPLDAGASVGQAALFRLHSSPGGVVTMLLLQPLATFDKETTRPEGYRLRLLVTDQVHTGWTSDDQNL